VLAADTVVVVDGEILGKPRDDAEAGRMLRRLSGRSHEVVSAVCLRRPAVRLEFDAATSTEVEVARLDEPTIAWYLASGEPRDKAGAYAVQGLAAMFVDGIEGNYNNVVGLPLTTVRRLLRELGHDWEEFRAPAGTAAP